MPVYSGDPTGVKNVLAWARRQGAGGGAGLPEVGGQLLQLLTTEQLGVGFSWTRGRQVAALFCKFSFHVTGNASVN